jgi:hypothetical protein
MGSDCSFDLKDQDLLEDAKSECDSDSELDDATTPPPLKAFTFEIDADIDIDSKALRDMVSVDPVVRDGAQPQQGSLKAAPSLQAPVSRVFRKIHPELSETTFVRIALWLLVGIERIALCGA